MSEAYPFVMFMALVALFSPLAALSAFMPVVGHFTRGDQRRLAMGLFVNVAIFAAAAVWLGEPLLRLLGVSTAALTVTGGIAILLAGVPMMQGAGEVAPEQDAAMKGRAEGAGVARGEKGWQSVMFTPVTFPLTIGGTSFGMIVAFSANARGPMDQIAFTLAGIGYGAVAALTLVLAGHVHRRVSERARMILSRVAGILLTAIGVTLLADGGTRLVMATLATMRGG